MKNTINELIVAFAALFATECLAFVFCYLLCQLDFVFGQLLTIILMTCSGVLSFELSLIKQREARKNRK